MVSGSHAARYLRVDCTFIRATDKAVNIGQERLDCKEDFWVPRVFLHGADDNYVKRELADKRLLVGDSLELRIESWLCERKGIEGVAYSAR